MQSMGAFSVLGLYDETLLRDGREVQLFRARSADGGHCLIKLLRPERADEAHRRGWRQEFELQRRAAGPNIQVVEELLALPATVALRLEDIGGATLDERLAAGPLPITEALGVAIAVADALDGLHGRDILHLGVAPASVFCAPAGSHVRLGNFSRAMAGREIHATLSGSEEGTGYLATLAPERTGRLNRPVDARADLYGLGILIHWMVAGQPPFQADDLLGWVHAHLAQTPKALADRVPGVPRALDAIVARLLAKLPEHRYQSAWGLRADLQRVLDGLSAGRAPDHFPLGSEDFANQIRAAGRLYGRDRDVAALDAAYQRIADRGQAGILIAGDSGIGKSALVQELHRAIWIGSGRFVSGKVDQFQRNQPYAAMRQAFDELVGRLAEAADITPERLVARLGEALGDDLPFLQLFAPALKALTGRDLPVCANLVANEVRVRCRAAARAFLRLCLADGRPLVLFVDDLQWADAATLDIVEHLLEEDGLDRFLLIGAYRDGEVDANHPLALMFDRLAAQSRLPLRLELGQLHESDLVEWLAEALGSDPQRVRGLARLIHGKTSGTPFYVQRYLQFVHERGWLHFDRRARRWIWDEAALAASALTDNVAEMLLAQMSGLDETRRRLLAAGALLGASFSLAEAAALLGLDDESCEPAAHQLTAHGFLRSEGRGVYAFQHDRIQEAASRLIDPAGARILHGRIGAELLARLDERERAVRLFEILAHLSASIAATDPLPRRLEFARLAHQAGPRARLANATVPGGRYLEQALAVLGPAVWADEPELAFGLHSEAQQCAILNQAFDLAAGHFAAIAKHVDDPIRLAESRQRMVMQLTMQSRYQESIELGLRSIAELGEAVDLDHLPENTARELERYFNLVGDARDEDILSWEGAVDPRLDAVLMLMQALNSIAYIANPQLSLFIAPRIMNLGLSHRTTRKLGYVMAISTISFITYRNDYQIGAHLTRLAMKLAEKHHDPIDFGTSAHVGALLSLHWTMAPADVLPYARRAFEVLDQYGDRQMAGFTFYETIVMRLEASEPLYEVAQEIERALVYVRRSGDRFALDSFLVFRQVVRAWRGLTRAPTSLDDDEFTEAGYLTDVTNNMGRAYFHTYKAALANFAGDDALALEQARLAGEFMPFVRGMMVQALHALHLGLACSRALAAGLPGDHAALRRELDAIVGQMAHWRSGSPVIFGHKHDLLRAEQAALDGEYWQAQSLYNQAQDGAHKGGFLHEEGLTGIRAAWFCRRRGLHRQAAGLTGSAYKAFAMWGADVLAVDARAGRAGESDLDLSSVLKGLEAITGELDYATLLDKLMMLALENAGAQRAMLLLVEPGEAPRPEAWVERAEAGPRVAAQREGAASFMPPAGALQAVLQTGQPWLAADAMADPRLAKDPHVRQRGLRSLLCLPLIRQRRVTGALYLENNLAPGLFAAGQVRLLGVIAGQAAIALESARLYGDMESLVRERTAQLDEARQAAEEATRVKSDFLANMSHEIRTPMNAIIGMTRLALKLELDDKARNYVAKVHRAAGNLLGIINDILDFSKIEAGKLELEHIDFRIADIFDHLASLIGLKAGERGLELHFDIAPDLPEMLVGDPLRLGQVLINLGNNAVKFTERGDIVIGVRALVQSAHGVEMHFWVKDSGIGMVPEECGRLFQWFNQVDSSTSRKYGGTGLGLAISKRLVEAMQGRIWVESTPGVGSTFHFHARFGVSNGMLATRRIPLAEDIHGLRVLVVDDNAMAREILVQMCGQLGLDAGAAIDGIDAMRRVRLALDDGRPYQLALVDWKMPVMDGIACIAALQREFGPRAPRAMLVSAHGADDMQETTQEQGVRMAGYMNKPMTASTLLETIGPIVGAVKAADSAHEASNRAALQKWAGLKGARLLLVEDNDLNQELASAVLDEVGIRLDIAGNGREALDMLARDADYGAILMDCQMPVMDGYETTRRIRADPALAQLPVIAMTANAMAADRDQALAAGMDDYIAKPLNIEATFATLMRWVKPR